MESMFGEEVLSLSLVQKQDADAEMPLRILSGLNQLGVHTLILAQLLFHTLSLYLCKYSTKGSL